MFQFIRVMGRFNLFAATLVVGPVAVERPAVAEIVLDSFEDPFQAVLPDVNLKYLNVNGIGTLNAGRSLEVVAYSSKPSGLIDGDISRDSSLSIQFDRLHITPGQLPSIGINLVYGFLPTDVTGGGINDRVVLDFAYLRSAVPLASINVLIDGRGLGRGVTLSNIPTSDTPFSLAFPFDATKFDATHATSLSVSISPYTSSSPEQINFSAAIDSIRMTSAVPEPSGWMLLGIGDVALFCFSRCRWRLSPCG